MRSGHTLGMSIATADSLVDILRWRAENQDRKTAFVFLEGPRLEEARLGYAELHRRAAMIAAFLGEVGRSDDPVALFFPPGLEYIAALMGCLYAGRVAVPLYPPRPNQKRLRVRSVLHNCRPELALTSEKNRAAIQSALAAEPGLSNLPVYGSDRLDESLATHWQPEKTDPNRIALLQYTSGSTGRPKGVMLSHGNLMANQRAISSAFDTRRDDIGLNWLPLYHDMGLIGTVLHPIYHGITSILMPSTTFVRQPLCWLEAISRYGATISGGPNFAYQLCVTKAEASPPENLDLSRWRLAFNGAEPIHPKTLTRFASCFEPHGFRQEAFYPCYGMAEATLLVTGPRAGRKPLTHQIDEALLAGVPGITQEIIPPAGKSRTLVSCGRPHGETHIKIVNPQTHEEAAPGSPGEIWIAGPGVAKGYWGRPELTHETFQARLTESEDSPFLRTGDLGILEAGELIVTGRLKDLIIIRGRNHYPQDIESTVNEAHPCLRPGCCAAFAVEREGVPRLVVVQEVSRGFLRGLDRAAVVAAIRTAVSDRHELRVSAVVLLKPGGIPKTSSGKIQRFACREGYLNQNLPTISGTTMASRPGKKSRPMPLPEEAPTSSIPPDSPQNRLRRVVASELELEPSEISPDRPLLDLGIDSMSAITLQHRFERECGLLVPAAAILDGLSIVDLAEKGAFETSSAPSPSEDRDGQPFAEAILSPNQQALWFLQRLTPRSAAYNLFFAVSLSTDQDISELRAIFRRLLQRHPALRTRFLVKDGRPVQKIDGAPEPFFESIQATHWPREKLDAFLAQEAHRPFDLENDSLLRLHLLSLSREEHVLLLTAHHIMVDFWSLLLILEEAGRCFSDPTLSLPAPTHSLADYAAEQSALPASEEGERLARFWEGRLSGPIPVLELPTDHPRPAVQSFRGAARFFHIESGLTRNLQQLSAANRTTLYTLLLSAFQVLLHRYSGQDRIWLGSPWAARDRACYRDVVGYFVNPLVLNAELTGKQSFTSFLASGRQKVIEALAHASFPFQQLVERLAPERDPGRSPLFQAMFTLLKPHSLQRAGAFALCQPGATLQFDGLALKPYPIQRRVTQFDITLLLAESADGLAGSLEYNSDLFEDETASRMIQHFRNLLAAIAADPDRLIDDLEMLSAREKQRVLVEWNDNRTDISADPWVPRFFESQARRTPDRIALVFEEQQIGYRTLNHLADHLARQLLQRGITPDATVAILLPRGPSLPLAMLAVLKSGGAYVPLDPELPERRIRYILQDSGALLCITAPDMAETLDRIGTPQLHANPVEWRSSATGPQHKNAVTSPNQTAYLIYTSGSTGRPKGVCVSHYNVVNFLAAMDRTLLSGAAKTDAPGTWLAVTNASFDISVLELIWTLTTGFKTVLQRVAGGALFDAPAAAHARRNMDFSLFYFADVADDTAAGDQYRLLLEGARFADRHGFSAVWTPERHFHAFGGLYPNPSVVGAAIAAITERIGIRAGSVVLPLHNPIRVAEEWALVDNLSKGRVGISIAPGWNEDDFVFQPDHFQNNQEIMFQSLETVRKLWRGESIARRGGRGKTVSVSIRPRPVQTELPVWLTAAGNPETFSAAGRLGTNLLTHLLGQSIEELEEKVELYRESRREHGHDAEAGRVTLMLHTFLGDDLEQVRRIVEGPFKRYLRSSLGLMRHLANELGLDVESEDFTQEALATLLSHAFDRYFATSALFGTPTTCLGLIDRLKGIGVDEIGCLIDFGVEVDQVMASLEQLDQLRIRCRRAGHAMSYSLSSQIHRHRVTHLQVTPSMAGLLLADGSARGALGRLQWLLIGGEALPQSLVEPLSQATDAAILNMYGPTETTIWSATHRLTAAEDAVPIGRPVANTTLYVAGRHLRPQPVGVHGELWIGGDGVARGYQKKPALSADRFVPDSFGTLPGQRLYRTGDLVLYRPKGELLFLGRLDHQLKIRGFRIELGEIEATLRRHPKVVEAVVTAAPSPHGSPRLVAFIASGPGTTGRKNGGSGLVREREIHTFLSHELPAHMIPAVFLFLENLPLNTSGKIDRNELVRRAAAASDGAANSKTQAPPQTELERGIAEVWCGVLQRDEVSIHDSFFELGGHSLLLARVHAQLVPLFGADLSMVALFQYPTIHSLAAFLAREKQVPEARAKPAVSRPPRLKPPANPAAAGQNAVAIIGLACRFPGADNAHDFWRNLRDGVESIRFFSDEELAAAGVDQALYTLPNYVKAGAVLNHVEHFDAAFFGFSPREAELLDPQHRLFLECAWEALENAAYDPFTFPGLIGVFAGSGMNTYLLHNLYPNQGRIAADQFQIMIANDKDFLPSRLSYKLNLRGPSVTVQTGCSTSLVAVDQACQSLLSGRCHMALAGAASVRSPQNAGYLHQEDMIASRDGHTRAFDADASGTLFGSGAGVLVLKPLAAALADADCIHAVIKGSATNNDGSLKISYTAPSVEGQTAVIARALAAAGVEPDSIGYVETHGTGTELGDPIELEALDQAFRPHTSRQNFCALGSVKSNFGHLDTAAGAAGLIKTVLALQHGAIPPTLHVRNPNPRLRLEGGPFYLNTQTRKWPKQNQPRRAGVSSFGIGGTNAHIILERAPKCESRPPHRSAHLLLLSAKTPTALVNSAQRLARHLADHPALSMADVAHTLQVGRAAFTERWCGVCGDGEDAVELLRGTQPQRTVSGRAFQNPVVTFMFPGGGAQYPNMARELYQTETVFRQEVDRCALFLESELGLDLRGLLYPEPDQEENAALQLRDIRFMLPAVFTTSYGLARLWLSWGIRPRSMIGHSLGEYTAACLAGVFSLEDALALVAFRGRFFDSLPRGAMLGVSLAEETLKPLLDENLSIATVNTPTHCVVAGPPTAIADLETRLEAEGADYRRLHIDVPAHSRMLDPHLERFQAFVNRLRLHPPQIPFVSNVSGSWITPEQATDPGYWSEHLRRTVRFSQGLELLFGEPHHVLLELGPGTNLSTFVRRHPARAEEHMPLAALRHPHEDRSDCAVLLECLGRWWLAGGRVDWQAFSARAGRRRLPLPTYPFERQRYWIDAPGIVPHHPPGGAPRGDSSPDSQAERLYSAPMTSQKPCAEARNEKETRILSIWREILGLARIGIHDNFFMLGGDSLLAIRVNSQLRIHFKAELPPRALFQNPTAAELAAHLEGSAQTTDAAEIRPMSREGSPPLSFAQQRLWFLDQLEGKTAAYLMQEAFTLNGPLCIPALEFGVNAIIERHEALRTTFASPEGEPHMVIASAPQPLLPVIDLTSDRSAGPRQRMRAIARHNASLPFNLETGPLARLTLLRLGRERHVLLVTLHHIISDGWSVALMVRELAAFYRAFTHQRPDGLPPLPIQYADFAYWQRYEQSAALLERQNAYWKRQLGGAPALLELPTDRPRPPMQTFHGNMLRFMLDAGLVERLKNLANRRGATLFMTLQAAFSVLLSRYSGQEDLVIGSPVANRTRAEIEPLIGFFVNTLVLRTDLCGDPRFGALLEGTRDTALEAFANQDIPFEQVVEALQPERNLSYSPLFQVMFILQNVPVRLSDFPGLVLEPLRIEHVTAMFDLTLFLEECGEELEGIFEYNSDLFDAATLERMSRNYRTLLKGIVADCETRISRLPLLDEEERRLLLEVWNATNAPGSRIRGAHEFFETRTASQPDRVALVRQRRRLTYAELDRRAGLIADQLQALGVGPEVRVALLLDRGPELIPAMLAVLKTGGVYVPLDPGYPHERLAFILEDAAAAVVLTRQSHAHLLGEHGPRLILVDDPPANAGRPGVEEVPRPTRQINGGQLSHIIYTSGSTGKPKGVAICHAGLSALLDWIEEAFPASVFRGCLASTSICFDLSVFEIFGTLSRGGTIILVENALELLRGGHEEVSLINTVPSAMTEIVRANALPRSALTINLAGEPLHRELVEALFDRPRVRAVYNLYGPSEDTTYSTFARLHKREPGPPPIGRPVSGSGAHVLDLNLQSVPIGVFGALYLAGAGLARGYLNRPALTAAAFCPDPFSAQPGSRLHGSGDLVRYLPDGRLVFAGRLDHQVKIRGFRIEPGEVEAVLTRHPRVAANAVVVRQDAGGGLGLAAYVVGGLKGDEKDLNEQTQRSAGEQVSNWEQVWQELYRGEAADDPTFNLVGWNDSYTGRPIAADQMREWLDGCTAKILEREPGRVLELGCGTGLVLFRVAPLASHYHATDLSQNALAYIRRHLKKAGLSKGKVTLEQGTGVELASLKPASFDTIILNSVVQYFPHIEYLVSVLEKAIELTAPGGRIFLGDIRHYGLLEAQHASIQLKHAADGQSAEGLDHRIREVLRQETELAIEPNFFHALPQHLPRIGRVRVQLKAGRAHNELTRFRYDVTLFLDKRPVAAGRPATLDWQAGGLTMAHVAERLKKDAKQGAFLLTEVPNPRLQPAMHLLWRLKNGSPTATVDDLRQILASKGFFDGVEPDAWCEIAQARGYRVEIGWSGTLECYDALFFPKDSEPPLEKQKTASIELPPWRQYANQPLQGRLNSELIPELRAYLQAKLPDFMVPTAFVLLDSMPLTPNGKIDRGALAATETPSQGPRVVGTRPQTPTERALAALWEGVLGRDEIDTRTSFFELGGHSLLATQIISRIATSFQVSPPLTDMFEFPTITAMSERIDMARRRNRRRSPPPIQPARRVGPPPLSFAQQRLWLIDKLGEQKAAYNMPAAVSIKGPLLLHALENALNHIIARHETLRTNFGENEGQPIQVIHSQRRLILPVLDTSGLTSKSSDAILNRLATEEARHCFDLQNETLLRVRLIRRADQDHALLLTMHHVISDGWSITVLLRELPTLYGAAREDRPPALPALAIQYADFAYWQRQWVSSSMLEGQRRYWRGQLAGAPTLLELPTDSRRPEQQRFRGGLVPFELEARLTGSLQDLSRRTETTLFMVLQTLFATLLGRYGGQDDIVLGTPIANRNRQEIEPLIGFFVNTLALRNDLGRNPAFFDLLGRSRAMILAAFDHQDLPFERVVDLVQPERKLNHTPVFQVMFDMQDLPLEEKHFAGLTLSPLETEHVTTKFDLTLSMAETAQGLHGVLEYDADLFERGSIERMAHRFRLLAESATTNPGRRIADLSLLDTAERRLVLVTWNETGADYPSESCIHELFDTRARQTPEATAIQENHTAGNRFLTYGELAGRSRTLARVLIEAGAGVETRVAVLAERSLGTLTSMLAALRAGAAYLPLDPTYPEQRLQWMLADANAAVLVASEDSILDSVRAKIPIIRPDRAAAEISGGTRPTGVDAKLPACLIYTSGSTGKPKAVVVTHRNLVNHAHALGRRYELNPTDRVLQFASLSFDVAGEELYPTWFGGATVVLRPADTELAFESFTRWVTRQGLTVLNLPATYWHEWVADLDRRKADAPSGPRLLVVGNERVLPQRLRQWCRGRHSPLAWRNAYGPTEATITSILYAPASIEEALQFDPIPIGQPIANMSAYILDRVLQPLPTDIPGELWIGGDGLARGYFLRPALTAATFCPNPWSERFGDRIYRTGDLARRRPAGSECLIEFIGRIDQQVKLRGFRIELGEIEAVLAHHPEVKDAVVLSRESEEGPRLTGFIIAEQEALAAASPPAEFWPSVGEFPIYDDLLYRAMTTDNPRNERYLAAIRAAVRGRVVLDIGTGKDALLARFCAEAGARKVYAVELLDEAYRSASACIKTLNLQDRIHLLPGASNEVELPEKVDVCVSEIIGTIGSSEGVIPTLNDARQRFLKPDGIMIPQRCITHIAAVRLPDALLDQPYFSEVPGYYIRRLFDHFGRPFDPRLCIKNLPLQNLLSEAGVFEDLDFRAMVEPAQERETSLKIRKTGRLDGFLLWIELHTATGEIIDVLEREYSWLPVFFPVFQPGIEVSENDRLDLRLRGTPCANGVNRDYSVSGTLVRSSNDPLAFHHEAPHVESRFRDNAFYARLFQGGQVNIVETPKSGTLVSRLRTYLRGLLPSYMIPSDFATLRSWPLTPSGKVDRRALAALAPAKTRATKSFMPPRTRAERVLVEIWASLLGLDKVSIHANFFELGGDSILGIQIVSRARKAGLVLNPMQLFQHQTIAELAAAAKTSASEEASSKPASGEVPLTPIQRWFFEFHAATPHHYNQAVLLRVPVTIKPNTLRLVLDQLSTHHDAFQLRFESTPTGWKQAYGSSGSGLTFEIHDSDAADERAWAHEIEALSTQRQAAMDILRGPLARVVLFRRGKAGARLLFIIHHLIMDGVSWRILLEDLQTLYASMRLSTRDVDLPAKTATFQEWSAALQRYRGSRAFAVEKAYWVSVMEQFRDEGPRLLPRDLSCRPEDHRAATQASIHLSLSLDETRALLRDTHHAYHTRIDDLLLTALALSMYAWTGSQVAWVDLEAHGREPLASDIDLSRGLGWFTSVYPVRLALESGADRGLALKSIKEQLRRVPNQGIGFGLLRYNEEETTGPLGEVGFGPAQTAFNYLGQVDRVLEESSLFGIAPEPFGPVHDPSARRTHLLEINAMVRSGRLRMEWTYSTKVHQQSTISRVARRYLAELRALIEHCRGLSKRGYTPSDFPLARLDQAKLDGLVAEADDLQDIYALSPMQEGMLFHSLLDPEAPTYFEQLSCELIGKLDEHAFRAAWNLLLERHALPRSSFHWEGLEKPVQVVHSRWEADWSVHDWSQLEPRERELRLADLLEEDRQRGFDLKRAPVMRWLLIRLADDRFQLVWSHHHLIMDGWSLPILFDEVLAAYEALRDQRRPELAPTRPYRDYIAWLSNQQPGRMKGFWRESLAGLKGPTPQLGDPPPSGAERPAEDRVQRRLGTALTRSLDQLARGHRLTTSTIVQGAWALLLARYTALDEVVFGVTVSGRPAELEGVEKMVGLFINTLPARVRIPGSAMLIPWLQELQMQHAEREAHGGAALVDIQRWAGLKGRHNLFESILVFENYPLGQADDTAPAGLEIRGIRLFEQTNFPLTLVAAPGKALSLSAHFDSNRFAARAMAEILLNLETLLANLAERPDSALRDLSPMTERQRRLVLETWNQTTTDPAAVGGAHQWFEANVRLAPHRIAVSVEPSERGRHIPASLQVSHAWLNAFAEFLAGRLQELGVTRESRCAILCDRSPRLVAAQLSVLKLGACFLPLDPAHPRDLLAYILADARPAVLLVAGALAATAANLEVPSLVMDEDWMPTAVESATNSSEAPHPEQAAYLIYTSGSTGRPKGVTVPHRGLANLARWHHAAFAVTDRDRVAQCAGVAFDASVWEIWPNLSAGATLCPLAAEPLTDTEALRDHLVRLAITITFLPTPLAEPLLELSWPANTTLRRVLTGGDRLHGYPPAGLPFTLFNNYGPTESSVVTTSGPVRPSGQAKGFAAPVIGRPIANLSVYALDKLSRLQAPGMLGELAIGGAGLARGYARRPALTAASFIPDPFGRQAGGRLYRSGDMGRFRRDGTIEFHGRRDHQLKIRGYRIELAEIETVLAMHPAIREAVVMLREDIPDHGRLTAYLVETPGETLTGQENPTAPRPLPPSRPDLTTDLRAFLRSRLPEYMLPACFVFLGRLPLTANGKLDRDALPVPEPGDGFEPHTSPRTPVEETLANILAEVLGLERVSVHADFFDLGGHSLMANQVVQRIHEAFQTRLPLARLFEAPTVAGLADLIETSKWAAQSRMEPGSSSNPSDRPDLDEEEGEV